VATTGKGLLEAKTVEIQTQISDDLPHIRADRQRLLQILLNIISNACKFTDEGSIRISAQRQDDQIVISVTDTGPGIAPEDQAAVFEAFKQTNSGLRQGGGTGLGMPISKNLAKAHGGDIELRSKAGEGATFIVTLPVKSDLLVPTLK
jgi:signal transduction histidine kinase